jgi:uncharacterized membrane protein YfcA
MPTILLVLALPAGVIGYLIGARVLEAVLPDGLDGLVPFAALLIAGLAMLPFLIPFVDRKAKQDLAAYRASQGMDPEADGAPPANDVDR